MAWCECECGHHRAHHPWVGYGPFGTKSGRCGCGICTVCGRESDEHYFVNHEFDRCPCKEYEETA